MLVQLGIREGAIDSSVAVAKRITSDIVIGAVGRLETQKRFDLLVEAVDAVLPRYPGLRLLVAGEGSLRGDLQSLIARHGREDACRLVGQVDDIVEFHHALDLLVQSSEYEGTPNAVLEAMALETPIVATDAGGTAEIVHHDVHGRIVPMHDGDRLFHAIETALREPRRTRAMADRARQRVEGELSFEARVRRVEAVYDEVAGHA